MRRSLALGGLTACLGLSSFLAAGPALAAPATTAAPASAGGTAPACIKRYTGSGDGNEWYAIVENDCGKTMRVKVYGTLPWQESACHTLAPGQDFEHRDNLGQYRKTVVC
ncbi:hypothetical protein [Pseudonocardia acidicola]|uniref:Alpha amylase inhibitor n=1 Tax=Pseudonocardia acidicola TaxID=2724939 RepID=A0ABX1SPS7_9PSEU|nr:hypothetical protein [Pseudonocardia acidicola]NMI02320.1 hypothetical protein [Pseudonocardia acidicola]